MTAKDLYLQIEDKIHETLALCDIVSAAALSNDSILDSESVARVMNITVLNLRGIIDTCDYSMKEEG